MRPTPNLESEKFGRLTVLSRSDNDSNNKTQWLCVCNCGNEVIVRANSLLRGNNRSCGCLQQEVITATRTHGASHRGERTRAYTAWAAMKQRCRGVGKLNLNNYKARGITVCKRWNKFENFLADMGECPYELSLERENNNKGYSKSNCKWATRTEQNNNKRNINMYLFCKESKTTRYWSIDPRCVVSYEVLRERLARGWDIKRALEEPAGQWHKLRRLENK